MAQSKTWRVSKSLEKLRAQVNAAAPGRSKASDGTKGDDAHAARKSDHNPDSKGVVRALDITHDPKGGVDSEKLAEALRISRDPRISYIISNRKIASSVAVHGEAAWSWRLYSGANPHNHHCHISVVADDARADDVSPWAIEPAFASTVAPKVTTQTVIVPATDRRSRMGAVILGYEARRDKAGHLAVYALPSNDGGGSYEVAGINDRYHPQQASHLRELIRAGAFDEAEASAVEFMVKYTDVAAGWTTNAGVEFFLRDCVFNRGPGGAAKILQIALGVGVDGKVGQETRDALAKVEPGALLEKLRAAREHYEDQVAPGRPNLRPGLVNRWNKALADARKFAGETPTTTQGRVADAGKVIVAAGEAATVKHGVDQGWTWVEWAMLVGGSLLVLALAFFVWRYLWPKFREWRARPKATAFDRVIEASEEDPAPAQASRVLPSPSSIWLSVPPVKPTRGKRPAPRRRAAKPKAKPKRKSSKRKAA